MCRRQTLGDQGVGDAQQNAIATAEDSPERLAQNEPDIECLVIVACIKVASARRSTISHGEGALMTHRCICSM